MSRYIEVQRIPVPTVGAFNYVAAKAAIADADARGDVVTVDGRDLVILTKIRIVKGRAA